jgi:hypothetical protein
MFIRSKRVHIHVAKVRTIRQAIDLIDRFIANELEYPLEWDDFVSWSNANLTVEELRNQIADLEPLFFSKDKGTRAHALECLINYRNKYAVLIGREPASD